MSQNDTMFQQLNKGFEQMAPDCLDSILSAVHTAPVIANEEELFAALKAAPLANAPVAAPIPIFRNRLVWGAAAAAACFVLGFFAVRPAIFRAPAPTALGVIYVDAQKSVALAYNTNHVVTDIFTTDESSVELCETLKAEIGENSTVLEALDTAFALMDDLEDPECSCPAGIISCRTLDSCSDSDVTSDQEYFSCEVVAHVQEKVSGKQDHAYMMICQNVTSQTLFDPTADDRNLTPGMYYFFQWLMEHYDLDLNEIPEELLSNTDQLFTYLTEQGIDITKDFQIINDTLFVPADSIVDGGSSVGPGSFGEYEALAGTSGSKESSAEASSEETSAENLQESENTLVIENTTPAPSEPVRPTEPETPHYNPGAPSDPVRPTEPETPHYNPGAPSNPVRPPVEVETPPQHMDALETTKGEKNMESYADTTDRVIEYVQDSSSIAGPSITEIYETSKEETSVEPEILPEESSAHQEKADTVLAPEQDDPTAPGDRYADSQYENYSNWWKKFYKKNKYYNKKK